MSCYCEYGDAEMPEFFLSQTVRARKTHTCYECKSDIAAGEMYVRESGKWDGEFNVYKTCMSCKEIRDLWEKQPYFENFTYGNVGCWYSGYLDQIADEMGLPS